jgi:hypothetical protein
MHNRGLAKRRVLRIIRTIHPKTSHELESMGLRLREILSKTKEGNGAFRRAYRIVGTNLVIKFPQIGWECKQHTRDEVKKIRELSKYRSLRSHLPPVYYYNRRDGVMVTDYYPYVCPCKAKNEVLSDVIRELTGVHLDDIMGDNVRMKQVAGNPIFCDLGY